MIRSLAILTVLAVGAFAVPQDKMEKKDDKMSNDKMSKKKKKKADKMEKDKMDKMEKKP